MNRSDPSRSIVPGIPFEMSFVRSYVKSQSCTGVVFAHATPNLILETQPTHCLFSLTSQGDICKAVSTRGQSRPLAFESVWLRVRMHITERKNRSKADNKDIRQRKRKKLTTPAPAMSRNNITAHLTGFTRSHTCTASHRRKQQNGELTKA